MASEQLNVKIRAELARAVKVRAAQEGIKPFRVIEELIEGASWLPSSESARIPSVAAGSESPPQDAPPLPAGASTAACPECSGDLARADDGRERCTDCGWTR